MKSRFVLPDMSSFHILRFVKQLKCYKNDTKAGYTVSSHSKMEKLNDTEVKVMEFLLRVCSKVRICVVSSLEDLLIFSIFPKNRALLFSVHILADLQKNIKIS